MRKKCIRMTVHAHNTLISLYYHHGMPEKARQQLVQLQQNGLRPDTVTYNLEIREAGGYRRRGKAEKVSQGMRAGGIHSTPSLRTFVLMIKGYADIGDSANAQAKFDEMMAVYSAGRLDS